MSWVILSPSSDASFWRLGASARNQKAANIAEDDEGDQDGAVRGLHGATDSRQMLAAFLAFWVCSAAEFLAAWAGPRAQARLTPASSVRPRRPPLLPRADRCVVEGDREVKGVGLPQSVDRRR